VAKAEVDKWNWGAFFWTWIWALGHRLWRQAVIGFVVGAFVPLAPNLYFGLRGNRLAWESGGFSSPEELRARQRRWAWGALFFYSAVVLVLGLLVVLGVFE
jgi:hypothetical protein